jgi:predicted dehydrogenase
MIHCRAPLNLALMIRDNDGMPAKVRWGVLGAANIALTKVIPGMQRAANCEVAAIASRDYDRAAAAAHSLGIATAYGSYTALLQAPDIDAVYNPLPNHLHMPWSIQAMQAGKHVLCEKPITLTVAECRRMIEVRDRQRVVAGEAFMVHSHPQWLRARAIARSGEIGDLRAIQCTFSRSRDCKESRWACGPPIEMKNDREMANCWRNSGRSSGERLVEPAAFRVSRTAA